MSELQRKTRIRNWNKVRLLGMSLNSEGLTKEELEIFNSMKDTFKYLIYCWDKNNNQFKKEVNENICIR